MSKVLVTGASGFVGTQILGSLSGHDVTALVRSQNLGSASAVTEVLGDVTDEASLRGHFDGQDVIVHLVGIIEESGGSTFDSVIRKGTQNVLREAQRAGASRFVLMSALGARADEAFPYLNAKFAAEQLVQDSGIEYSIVRPSVIFGPGDGFINALAGVVRSFPVVPIVGDGSTRFQPVSVFDVADAFASIVSDRDVALNQIIEIGGAETLTYEQMIDLIALELERKRAKVHVPTGLMNLVVGVSSRLPKRMRPPVTSEQLKMLAIDNSTSPAALARLIGREPRSLRANIGYVRTH